MIGRAYDALDGAVTYTAFACWIVFLVAMFGGAVYLLVT